MLHLGVCSYLRKHKFLHDNHGHTCQCTSSLHICNSSISKDHLSRDVILQFSNTTLSHAIVAYLELARPQKRSRRFIHLKWPRITSHNFFHLWNINFGSINTDLHRTCLVFALAQLKLTRLFESCPESHDPFLQVSSSALRNAVLENVSWWCNF